MDELERPAELSEEIWQQMPLEGRQFIALLVANLVAALFFSVMRYDPRNPKAPNSDAACDPTTSVKVPGALPPTPYSRWGDGPVALLLAGLALLAATGRRKASH